MCMYIYIYIYRERDIERLIARERGIIQFIHRLGHAYINYTIHAVIALFQTTRPRSAVGTPETGERSRTLVNRTIIILDLSCDIHAHAPAPNKLYKLHDVPICS